MHSSWRSNVDKHGIPPLHLWVDMKGIMLNAIGIESQTVHGLTHQRNHKRVDFMAIQIWVVTSLHLKGRGRELSESEAAWPCFKV